MKCEAFGSKILKKVMSGRQLITEFLQIYVQFLGM